MSTGVTSIPMILAVAHETCVGNDIGVLHQRVLGDWTDDKRYVSSEVTALDYANHTAHLYDAVVHLYQTKRHQIKSCRRKCFVLRVRYTRR